MPVYHRLSEPPPPNLKGDRDIEYSWIAAHIPDGPGKALEVGCGQGSLGLLAACRGFTTVATDLTSVAWPYVHPKLSFSRTDVFDTAFPEGSLDLIVMCSVVEHIGLGRYGDPVSADSDLHAMQYLRTLLTEDSGRLLMTIPVGRDEVIDPFHRIYGPVRLPQLLRRFSIEEEAFWVKDDSNRWIATGRTTALSRRASASYYSIGCFALRSAL